MTTQMDNNLNRQVKKYLTFSDRYNDVNALSNLTELYLTPKEGFFIKDLIDFEVKKTYLNVLSKLDVSENILSKLALRSFLNLTILIASKNIIKEVNLILPKLVKLDLSFNFITKVFDLSFLPSIKELNLSNNLIEKVIIKDFQPVKFTLNELFLNNNNINFESNEFLSFIEGLKILNLTKFSLDGNEFIKNNLALTYSYNLFIVATITSLKSLNNQEIIINRQNLISDEIKNQIISEDGKFQVTRLKNKIQISDEKVLVNVEKQFDLVIMFTEINKNFENLLRSGGKNQKLLFNLTDNINLVLNLKLDQKILEKAIMEDSDEMIQFNLYLMNSLFLIEMNSNLENAILNPIAQFSLFWGGYLCEKCFEFFESLTKSSSKRVTNILSVFESVILRQLESTQELPFKCLKIIISFFNNTKITFSKLYINLINVILKELKKNLFGIYDNPIQIYNEKIKDFYNEKSNSIPGFTQIMVKLDKEIDLENFIVCLQFIIEYWKISEEEFLTLDDFETLSSNSLQSEISNEEEEENEEDYDDVSYSDSDEILEDIEVGDNVKSNLDNFSSEHQSLTIELFNVCIYIVAINVENLENLINMSNKRFDYISIIIDLGITLLQNIDKHMKAKKISSNKKTIVIDLINNFNIQKAYQNDRLRYATKDDSFNIFETISIFIVQSLGSYIVSYSNFYEYIKKYYIGYRNDDDSSNTLKNNKRSILLIFSKIIHLMGCFMKHSNDTIFKNLIDDKSVNLCFNIISSSNNDPFILLGACNFFMELLSYSKIMTDQMSFSKIVTKITHIRHILNFIDYENLKFRQTCELLSEFDTEIYKNNNLIPFEKLENNDLLKLIETIVLLIGQFCILSNRSGAITTQCLQVVRGFAENKMYSILSNCLKINNDYVRKAVVNCIYYIDHNTITNDVIKQIINIISNYSSVSDGETEIILSTIYLILNKILIENSKNDQMISQINENNIVESLNLAMTFLVRNTDRNVTDDSEIDQKNSLSASLILYLNTCSSNPNFWISFQRKELEDVIRKCLYNEYFYFSTDNYLTIEIERTHIGNYIGFLLEIMKQSSPVLPYSYTFLRILMKIGDVLLNSNETMFNVNVKDELNIVIEDQKKEINARFQFKIKNEVKNWYEFQRLMNYDLKKNMKKKKKNSYMKELSEEEHLDQQLNFIVFFPNILIYLLGKTSYLNDFGIYQDLYKKFDQELLSCEKLFFLMDNYLKNKELGNTELLDKNFEQIFLSDYKIISKSHNKNKIKLSSFITNYLIFTRNDLTKDWHQKKKIYYGVFHKELTVYSRYGIDSDAKRYINEENHNNPHLRSLIMSALLRCIYTALSSKHLIVRQNFIEIIINNNLFKDIIFLTDLTLIFEFNIHYKIFSVFSLLFSKKNIKIMETQKESVTKYRNLYYNCHLVSIFIEKILYFYQINIKSNLKLEISFCKDFIFFLYEFLNFVILFDLEKLMIDMNFTRYYIFQNLIKDYIIDILFYLDDEIKENIDLAFNEILQINLDSLNDKNVEFIKDHMLNYIYNLNVISFQLYEILAFFIEFFPSCKEYVFNHLLNFYLDKKIKENFNKESKNITEKALENLIFRSKICKIGFELKNELGEPVDFMEICECHYYPDNKGILSIVVLTDSYIFIFDKKEENNSIILEKSKKFELINLEVILMYDYQNRLFLVFNDGIINSEEINSFYKFGNKKYVFFSLFFKDLINGMMLIDKIKLKKDVSVNKFQTFNSTLHKIQEESLDGEPIKLKRKVQENEIKDEGSRKIFDKNEFTSKYTIRNNIFSHQNYIKLYEFSNFSYFFVISIDLKKWIDYINLFKILYNDASLIMEYKKILYVNGGYLYIFREKFENFYLTTEDVLKIPDDKSIVDCNSSNAYDLLLSIKMKSIEKVNLDKNLLKAKLDYKLIENSDSKDYSIEFSFEDKFQFTIFSYYINLNTGKLSELILKEAIENRDKNNEELETENN